MQKAVLTTLAFVGLYNLLFYQISPGIGTGFLFLAFNLFFFFNKDSQSKNLTLALLSSTVGVFFAFLLSFRDNDILQPFNYLIAAFFSLVALYFYKEKSKGAFPWSNMELKRQDFTQFWSNLLPIEH